MLDLSKTKSLSWYIYAALSKVWYFLHEYLRQDKVTQIDAAIQREETNNIYVKVGWGWLQWKGMTSQMPINIIS